MRVNFGLLEYSPIPRRRGKLCFCLCGEGGDFHCPGTGVGDTVDQTHYAASENFGLGSLLDEITASAL